MFKVKDVYTLPKKEIPKTLVLIIDLSLPGGVSHYYRTLGLNELHNVTYFPINSGKTQSVVKTALRLITNYWKFFVKVIQEDFETVVVNPSLDQGKSFYRDMVFIILTRILKRDIIVFFHGWYEPFEEKIKKSKSKSFLFKISYAKVKRYIVLGNIFKTKLISLGVPPTTTFFIESMVASSAYLNEVNLQEKYLSYEKEIKILFLSRIEKEKGIYIAIDAFHSFSLKYPQRKATLVIAGDGRDLPEVKDYVRNKAIPKINFVGYVDNVEKNKVLLESHIMIFPSFTEGLPNVILEGMLYGLPIIARSAGAISEVVIDDINGFTTESYDPAIFEEYLSKLSCDFELYRLMAEANHKVAREKFTSEKVKERVIKIYENFSD